MKLHSRVVQFIQAEIQGISRYFDEVIDDSSALSEVIEQDSASRRLFLLRGDFNYTFDIHGDLEKLKKKMHRGDRIAVVLLNPYLRFVYRYFKPLDLVHRDPPHTFVTQTDLKNISAAAGFELVRLRPAGYLPAFKFLNRLMPTIPLVRWFALTTVAVLRPQMVDNSLPLLSVVIPARNEKGNIESAVTRCQKALASIPYELIFVEGHSQDSTWEEIVKIKDKYQDAVGIQCFRQKGKGKADAVRLGFSQARGDLLTILDADLTMPPEMLPRFYFAYTEGHADFINGNRLVYPMEGEAMRLLNHLGNLFFAKALSVVLGAKLGDSLCGTKLLARKDYDRFIQWRMDFGDFDPFGDFELLFPAAVLGLGVMDIPVRYLARTYGQTNISRFRHGFMLLKMTLIGLVRIRAGQVRLPSQTFQRQRFRPMTQDIGSVITPRSMLVKREVDPAR